LKRRLLIVAALVTAGIAVTAGIVFAAGGGAWPTRGGPSVKSTTTGTGGAGCGKAYQTVEGEPFYPDNIVDLNGDWDALTPAASVTLVKKCHGNAILTFSSETAADQPEPPGGPTPQDVDNTDVVIIVRATCTHSLAGIPNPCHVGDRVYGSPGGNGDPVLFDLAPDLYEVHSMQWAFSALKPGTWTFDVLPANNTDTPNGYLDYRTLFVETL
jgi:hypothetical protein